MLVPYFTMIWIMYVFMQSPRWPQFAPAWRPSSCCASLTSSRLIGPGFSVASIEHMED